MKSVLSQIRRRHNTGRRFLKKREDESGLTTLEWLLIVAAVAGLAALAVVLVQNVVTETAEQISSSSARVTAAQLAGEELITKSVSSSQGAVSDTYGEWVAYYNLKCNRFNITYGDAGITVTANFKLKSRHRCRWRCRPRRYHPRQSDKTRQIPFPALMPQLRSAVSRVRNSTASNRQFRLAQLAETRQ